VRPGFPSALGKLWVRTASKPFPPREYQVHLGNRGQQQKDPQGFPWGSCGGLGYDEK